MFCNKNLLLLVLVTSVSVVPECFSSGKGNRRKKQEATEESESKRKHVGPPSLPFDLLVSAAASIDARNRREKLVFHDLTEFFGRNPVSPDAAQRIENIRISSIYSLVRAANAFLLEVARVVPAAAEASGAADTHLKAKEMLLDVVKGRFAELLELRPKRLDFSEVPAFSVGRDAGMLWEYFRNLLVLCTTDRQPVDFVVDLMRSLEGTDLQACMEFGSMLDRTIETQFPMVLKAHSLYHNPDLLRSSIETTMKENAEFARFVAEGYASLLSLCDSFRTKLAYIKLAVPPCKEAVEVLTSVGFVDLGDGEFEKPEAANASSVSSSSSSSYSSSSSSSSSSLSLR